MARSRVPREIEAQITELGSDGLGRAFHGERGLRVKNALVGETVTAKVLKRKKGLWFTEAYDITDSAPSRVAPACPNFPRCGGCAMQHLDYHAQLELKQQHVCDLLEAAEIRPQQIVEPTMGPRLHYRTKARLGVKLVGEHLLVGFRESFSNRVGRMSECQTLIPAFSRLIEPLRNLIASLSIVNRIPQVELASGDNQRALILRHLEQLTEADRLLLKNFGELHNIEVYLQSGNYDSIVSVGGGTKIACLGYANCDFGLHFQFLPWDFTQVNLQMNRQLVLAALSAMNAPAGSLVLDLFCGIGNFSLALARKGHRVIGYEAAQGCVDRAQMNARRNGLSHRCEFQIADLYDAACAELPDADYLLLDPPRSGAGVNLKRWLASIAPERVVYVSCEPKSFASDATIFGQLGYQLEQVGIFDMFPHTAHVETLGVFSR